MIGSVEVPLGVAGPITINGDHAQGRYFLPLATSEGALVASVNRGCAAISRSGGVRTSIKQDSQARSILLKATDIEAATSFIKWVDENKNPLFEAGEKGSSHLKIQGIEPFNN